MKPAKKPAKKPAMTLAIRTFATLVIVRNLCYQPAMRTRESIQIVQWQ
jgi:hypothetical protein